MASYQEEKRLAAERKREAWAEAEAEFAAWYQDVGTRAERHGHAGANRDKVITTLPKCFCGKATAALGLCENHYSQFWERQHGKFKGSRNQTALCHPERKHHGRGLCRQCYEKLPRSKARQMVKKRRNRIKKKLAQLLQTKKPGCIITATDAHGRIVASVNNRRLAWQCKHADKPNYGHGMCRACWRVAWRLKRGETKNPRVKMPRICGHEKHPTLPDVRGLCGRCYRREQMRLYRSRQKIAKEQARMLLATTADRPIPGGLNAS